MRRRKPLRRLGSRGLQYIQTRQEFLSLLLSGRERATFPCGMRVNGDGTPYADPEFAGGEVDVWIDLDLPPYPRICTNGEVHHNVSRSRRPDLRCDLTNLVLLTHAAHQAIEAKYQKGGMGT